MQRKYDRLPENIREVKSETNLAKWIPIVTECCNSGQSKKACCKICGVSGHIRINRFITNGNIGCQNNCKRNNCGTL